jgi:hypothetical protein
VIISSIGGMRGSACGQMEKLSAGKFHSSPSARHAIRWGRVRIDSC